MFLGSINTQNLIVGLAFDQVRLQKLANIYCNHLEYLADGVRPEICQQEFFTADILNQLTSVAKTDYDYRNFYTAYIPKSAKGKQHQRAR